MIDLQGRAALITGGTSGIGKAMAQAFLAAGANVCVVARREQMVRSAVDELSSIGPKVIGCAGSVADDEVRHKSVARCLDELGGLDILVNNAAAQGFIGPLGDAPWEEVEPAWVVNQEAPLRYAQLAWKAWMKEHGGNILNISSLAGVRTRRNFGAYGISKAALIHMTHQLAIDLAPKVRINGITPGTVITEMASDSILKGRDLEREGAKRPLARLGVPDDLAGLALFLVSDAASWITGQVIAVDGGAQYL